MPVFVNSVSEALRHGVYAVERQPPASVRATGTATTAIIEQFPWGPSQVLTTTTGMKNFFDLYAPAGMSRTGSGYLSVIRKGWPILKVVRVLGTGVNAVATLATVAPVSMITLTLKYPGTAGNSVTATTSAASDGDSNHFNLAVTVTGTSGTTTDTLQNLNYSGVGTDSDPDLTRCLLLGSIVKLASGFPVYAVYTFSTGADGTINAASYVGTAGSANQGVARLEGDRNIDGFCVGDPGNTLRAAVNAGLKAHADFMTDRVAYINGNSGLTQAATQTDVALYRSVRTVYVDSWVNIFDDTDGTTRLVPGAPFAASVAAQIPPSLSIAWKSDKIQAMLGGIVSLESDRGNASSTNTDAGIVTFCQEENGGFTFEAGVNTFAPSNPSKRNLTRTRMGHFIARSATSSLRSSVDAPNVPIVQQDEINAVEDFLGSLKANRLTDPFNKPYILDFTINDVNAFNSQEDIDSGVFVIPADIKIGSNQEKIILSMQYGETVRVATQL
jgi:phage tail sheath protein FI